MNHQLSIDALAFFDALYPLAEPLPGRRDLPAESSGTNLGLPSRSANSNMGRIRMNIADRASQVSVRKDTLNCLSFFSGAMGMDIGLEEAGVNILLACEFDRRCRETISANRPKVGLLGDINTYSTDSILEHAGAERDQIDLIVGGPPCQAFSTAGKRKGFEDERGNVFLRFIDVILDIRPKYFVIENVRGLLSAPLRHRPHVERSGGAPLSPDELPGGALRHIIDRLEGAGYGVSFNLYNAANFGTPQTRERVVIVGCRTGERLPYLMPTHSQDGVGLPKWRTVRDVIGDLGPHGDHIQFPEGRLRYFRMLKEGQYWRHLPSKVQKEALGASYFSGGGKTGFLRRLAWDKPSCTLVTHPAMPATDICHPVADRPLSVTEYKRIQQFPDDWELKGNLLDQYKQVGNAVPVGLGEAIGALIVNHNRGQVQVTPKGFKFSRYRNTDDQSWRIDSVVHIQGELGLVAA